MNRRNFLSTAALAPVGVALKNPVYGLFKQLVCDHEFTATYNYPSSGPHRPRFAGIQTCDLCDKKVKMNWVSYPIHYTVTLPSGTLVKMKCDA
jgi:hypothetical protein